MRPRPGRSGSGRAPSWRGGLRTSRRRAPRTAAREPPYESSRPYPETWGARQQDAAVIVGWPRVWVVCEEHRAVEVHEVDEARDLGRRRDTERGLDHAAEHDEHPVGAGGVDHLEGAPDTAALGELDVDPADAPGEPWHVGGLDGALVRDHGYGEGRLGYLAHGIRTGRCGHGLFDHAHPDLLQLGNDLDGLFRRKRLVGIDPEVGLRSFPDGPERLDVPPSPYLYLQDRKPPQPLCVGDGRLHVCDAKGVGRAAGNGEGAPGMGLNGLYSGLQVPSSKLSGDAL